MLHQGTYVKEYKISAFISTMRTIDEKIDLSRGADYHRKSRNRFSLLQNVVRGEEKVKTFFEKKAPLTVSPILYSSGAS